MSDNADGLRARFAKLMNAEDAAFMREAYQLLLGRGLDSEGEAFYRQRLVAGASRLEVLQELAQSDEGRAHLAGMPAVARALALQASGEATASTSLLEWMRAADHVFVQQALHALAGQVPDADTVRQLLARLRGGLPRYRLLQALADASGRQEFSEIIGLDQLLAESRAPLYPVASRLDDLYAFEDEAFVDCAYKTLLGRAPDFSGMAHYLDLLRQGQSKDTVLLGLASSSEGRARTATLPGLQRRLRFIRLARLPVLGALVGVVLGVDTETSRAQSSRLMRSIALRNNALEAHLKYGVAPNIEGSTAGSGAMPGRVQAQSLKSLETALLARHDALLDIQRDSFDRELTALRKIVIRMQDDMAHGEVLRTPNARRRLRFRR